MKIQLKQEFDEILEPLGENAASFFLAASLYHAHKVSFSSAANLANLNFNEFLNRLREHFGTGFHLPDDVVLNDLKTVDQMIAQ